MKSNLNSLSIVFLAPTGALEMQMSVRFKLVHNFHLLVFGLGLSSEVCIAGLLSSLVFLCRTVVQFCLAFSFVILTGRNCVALAPTSRH